MRHTGTASLNFAVILPVFILLSAFLILIFFVLAACLVSDSLRIFGVKASLFSKKYPGWEKFMGKLRNNTVLCWKLWAGYIWNDYYMEIEIETWKIPPYQVSEMVTWYGGIFRITIKQMSAGGCL